MIMMETVITVWKADYHHKTILVWITINYVWTCVFKMRGTYNKSHFKEFYPCFLLFFFKFLSLFWKVKKQTNTSRFINRKSLPPLTRHILNAPALKRLTNWPITNSQFETIAQRKGQKIIWVKPINCLRVNAWQIQSHSEQFSESWQRFLGKWKKKSRLKLCRYTIVTTFRTQVVKTVAFSSIHRKSRIDSALILMRTAVWSVIHKLKCI